MPKSITPSGRGGMTGGFFVMFFVQTLKKIHRFIIGNFIRKRITSRQKFMTLIYYFNN